MKMRDREHRHTTKISNRKTKISFVNFATNKSPCRNKTKVK